MLTTLTNTLFCAITASLVAFCLFIGTLFAVGAFIDHGVIHMIPAYCYEKTSRGEVKWVT